MRHSETHCLVQSYHDPVERPEVFHPPFAAQVIELNGFQAKSEKGGRLQGGSLVLLCYAICEFSSILARGAGISPNQATKMPLKRP